MTTSQTDRAAGLTGSIAQKAPARVATTANITLSGLQTVDGVVLAADNRVLVKNQTTQSENGIYYASTSSWQRTPDFDGVRDIVKGTMVRVLEGTGAQQYFYQVTSSGTNIGTDSITFSPFGLSPTSITALSLGDGSAPSPSLNFVNDPDTGLYRIGANNLGFATGGVQVGSFDATNFSVGVSNFNGLRYIDLYNLDTTTSSSGVNFRAITKNVANTGNVTFNMVKYQNGTVAFSNAETDAAAQYTFALGNFANINVFALSKSSNALIVSWSGTESANGADVLYHNYYGKDSASNSQVYASNKVTIESNVNGAECSSSQEYAMKSGALTAALKTGFDSSGNNIFSLFGQAMSASLGTNGYCSIPLSGSTIPRLILQWGIKTVAGSTKTAFNLPVAYTTAHYVGVASALLPDIGDIDGNESGYNNLSLSQYELTNCTTLSTNIGWFSIGY